MFGLKSKEHAMQVLFLLIIIAIFTTSVVLTLSIPKQYEEYTVEYANEVKEEVAKYADSDDVNKQMLKLKEEYSFDVMIFDEETLEYTSNELLYNVEYANDIYQEGYVYKGSFISSDHIFWLVVYESDLSSFVNDLLMRNLLLFITQALLMIMLLALVIRKTIRPLNKLVEIIKALRSEKNTVESNEKLDEISEELVKVSNELKLKLYSSQKEEKEYERRYHKQENLILEQRNHLANVVHDVKGTFAAINFSAQCIANVKALSEEEKLALQSIEDSSISALEYITSSLNSVIEDSVDIYIDKDEIDIKKTIEEFFEFNNMLLLEKNLQVEINGKEKSVELNILKFNHIIKNILSNMIKYSKQNSKLVIDIFDNKCVFTNVVGEAKKNYNNSFGLKSIKDSADDIGVEFKLEYDKKHAVFTLTFGDDMDA